MIDNLKTKTNKGENLIPISMFAENYPLSGIREMFDLLPNYPNAINLCNGEPDFPTPPHIVNEAITALKEGHTKYSPSSGITELRNAISKRYLEKYNYEVDSDNVMIVAGGTEGILTSLLGAINPNDEVIVTDPCYPNYEAQIALASGVMIRVPVFEKNKFLIEPSDLENSITTKTKAIILNYPNNPLGVRMTKKYADSLSSIISKYNLLVISDEVYEDIIFHGNNHYSLLQHPVLSKQVVVVSSLSKSYSMTGWRVGAIVGPASFMKNVVKMQESIISCLPVFIQKAAVKALNGDNKFTSKMVASFERRMKLLTSGLNSIFGFSCSETEGGLCVMANISSFGKSSLEFAKELLEEAQVMVVPGSAFGPMGEGYIRFCYANSEENILEGIKRVRNYINKKYRDIN